MSMIAAGRTEWPVAVVGGGVAGLNLAFELGRRGVPAVLLDAGRSGGQSASAVPVALLNPFRGRGARPGPFDLEGLAAFWRSCGRLQELGLESGARRSGVLRIAQGERRAASWANREGLLRLSTVPRSYRAPHGAFLVAGGGWVETGRLLAALTEAATGHGVTVLENRSVNQLEQVTGGWRVHGQDVDLRAQSVVLATGASEQPAVRLAAGGSPRMPELERNEGDLITLGAAPELPYPVAGPVYLVATAAGVHVGGNHRPAGTRDPHAARLLHESAARLVPELAGAPLLGKWTGVRARRPGNEPLCEELADGLWFLGAFGGRGFLTSALFAERLGARLATRHL